MARKLDRNNLPGFDRASQEMTETVYGEAVQQDRIDVSGDIEVDKLEQPMKKLVWDGSMMQEDLLEDADLYPGGVSFGGGPDDSDLTIMEATQGEVYTEGTGGSGGTGGDMTGERTPGGMSMDLTSGRAGGGKFGGPTGGDYGVYTEDLPERVPDTPVKGYHGYSTPETDEEIIQQAARDNTTSLLNEGHGTNPDI